VQVFQTWRQEPAVQELLKEPLYAKASAEQIRGLHKVGTGGRVGGTCGCARVRALLSRTDAESSSPMQTHSITTPLFFSNTDTLHYTPHTTTHNNNSRQGRFGRAGGEGTTTMVGSAEVRDLGSAYGTLSRSVPVFFDFRWVGLSEGGGCLGRGWWLANGRWAPDAGLGLYVLGMNWDVVGSPLHVISILAPAVLV
jgi:hypothetical protein